MRVHIRILARVHIGEPAAGAGDEIPPQSPLCQRGEARSAGGFVRERKEITGIARKLICTFHGDERGQLLYLTVVSVVIFVAFAALIINSGHMVTRKIETQNAVDAAAVSSAAWIARGMNIISMDNVAMTELLAFTVVLRALKETWEEGLDRANIILPTEPVACTISALGTAAALKACETYFKSVKAAKEYFKRHLDPLGPLIDAATDPENGFLWQAIRLLEKLNVVVANGFPWRAAEEAERIARANKADGIQMLPLFPTMPIEQGKFSDLCHPTRVGSPRSYPRALQRGYVPLLGYPHHYDHGPLLVYRDMADGPLLKFFLFLVYPEEVFIAGSRLERNTDTEFTEFCRGSAASDYTSSRDAPRPSLLKGTNRSTNRSVEALRAAQDDLNYLGIAWRQSESIFMPVRFANPREWICAYGQARVFNSTSFDLFTQDWRVKLVKADMLENGGGLWLASVPECGQLEAAAGASLLNAH